MPRAGAQAPSRDPHLPDRRQHLRGTVPVAAEPPLAARSGRPSSLLCPAMPSDPDGRPGRISADIEPGEPDGAVVPPPGDPGTATGPLRDPGVAQPDPPDVPARGIPGCGGEESAVSAPEPRPAGRALGCHEVETGELTATTA